MGEESWLFDIDILWILCGFFYILLFIDDGIKMILVRFIFGLVICVILIVFSLVLFGDSYENNNNKNTIFECGVIIDKLRRKSFSLRFFLFIILFLIFEMEIILFVPVRIIQDFSLIKNKIINKKNRKEK